MTKQRRHRRGSASHPPDLLRPSTLPFDIERGDIIWLKYEQSVGIEINTTSSSKPDGRPSVVIQVYDDSFLQVVPVRDFGSCQGLDGQVIIDKESLGSRGKVSYADCRQLQGADPSRITRHKGVVGRLGKDKMAEIEIGLKRTQQLN